MSTTDTHPEATLAEGNTPPAEVEVEDNTNYPFDYPAIDPPDALYFTRNLHWLGPLPILKEYPKLPPAVYFFIYCQTSCQDCFHEDFIPLIQTYSMRLLPRPPNAYLRATTDKAAFYHTVMLLLRDDFNNPAYSYNLDRFIKQELVPLYHEIPPAFQGFIQPFLAGGGDNFNHGQFHGYSTAQPPVLQTVPLGAAAAIPSATTSPPTAAPAAVPAPAATAAASPPATASPAAVYRTEVQTSAPLPPAATTSTTSGPSSTQSSGLASLLNTGSLDMGPVGMSGRNLLQSLGRILSNPAPYAPPSHTGPSPVTGISYDETDVWTRLRNTFSNPHATSPAVCAPLFPPITTGTGVANTQPAAFPMFNFGANVHAEPSYSAVTAPAAPAAGPSNPAVTAALAASSPVVTAPAVPVAVAAPAAPAAPAAVPAAAAPAAPVQAAPQVSLAPLSQGYMFPFPFVAQQASLPPHITASSAYQMPFVPMADALNPTFFHPVLAAPAVQPVQPYVPAHPNVAAPVAMLQVTPPPKFTGSLTNDIPDLHVWFRRVERVADRQHMHLLDVLDDCTVKDANALIQQMYHQHISDPAQVKSHFFAHYSYLLQRNTDAAFTKLMHGDIKMKSEEQMETFINRFRLAIADAGITELELTPGSTLVRTMVALFTQALPDAMEKDFRNGDRGTPFQTMQSLYLYAVQVGKKHQKRKAVTPTEDPAAKKQKTLPTTKPPPRKVPTKPVSNKPPSKPAYNNKSVPQGNRNQPAPQGNRPRVPTPPLVKKAKDAYKALVAMPADSRPKTVPALTSDIPDWPTPLPDNPDPSDVEPDDLHIGVMKQLVGSTRFNRASHEHQCAFCAAPLDMTRLPSEHYSQCPNRPF